jgi:two-component system sensor histidine kinase KdpD
LKVGDGVQDEEDSFVHERRPDPDALLARVQQEEARERRGKLKVFFGAAPGVGKTYAMLRAARARQAEGVDVVAGYVETHGRTETDALLTDLERLPQRTIEYRGIALTEFDLEAALARRPQLLLVDELAHTNAPGSRHARRWQDVEELVASGINVYTTLNVQHLESLNDVVAQITGIAVRETVPDRVIEEADEVELIDLPADDLLQRLKEGKVYIPQQAERAMGNFFRKGNLIALRELALRVTAEQVDDQMQDYRRDHAIENTWPAAERILVCVSPSPLSVRLVRAARRMAVGLRAEWIVLSIETPATLAAGAEGRNRVVRTLRLAEQLGATTVTLSGQKASEEILAFARTRNVTKIVVGKPARPRWREILFGSVVDEVIRKSGDIDVYVITGEENSAPPLNGASASRPTGSGREYGLTLLVIALCTLVAWVLSGRVELVNVAMVYLLGVVGIAARFGRGPSVLASVLSVALFDFFFVPPYLTFAVADTQYLLTFGVMLTVALSISTLTSRVRLAAQTARLQERRTAALYAMSREFAAAADTVQVARAASTHLAEVFEGDAAILLPDAQDRLQVSGGAQAFLAVPSEQAVARWAYDRGRPAGADTQTLPGAEATYLPLIASGKTVGVVGVRSGQKHRFLDPEQFHLLEAFANQTALAVERTLLGRQAEQARVQVEAEQLRNALLSSVSHDLRTPLAVIAGITSSLLESAAFAEPSQRLMVQTVYDEAERLNRLVRNLLDMTRLEAGALQLRKEWHSLEELVGVAFARLDALIGQHPLTVDLPATLPLVPLDAVLVEQVLINLLENAVRHTPPGTPLTLSARVVSDSLVVELADRGPGIAPGSERRIFEKFYRADERGLATGLGLGLTICRGIVAAHGGEIEAHNRPGGGAVFRFSLPLGTQAPPAVAREVAE